MLGTLARKLRVYGFDTRYDQSSKDETLLTQSLEEGRVLLTSDHELFRKSVKKSSQSILLLENSDEDRLVKIFKELKLIPANISPNEARCSVCNGTTRNVGREDVRSLVAGGVLLAHENFHVCTNCGKIYWEGGHWWRLRAFSEKVRERLLNTAGKE